MSKPAPLSQKKRKLEDGMRGKVQKPRKKIRKQKAYHSSSEDEEQSDTGFAPVNLNDSDEETPVPKALPKATRPSSKKTKPAVARKKESEGESDDTGAEDREGDEDDDEEENSDSQGERTTTKRKTSKRNDPEAFSTSISKILSTKLSQSARKDPVLSRSKEAAEISSTIANEKLESRARSKIRAEKKEDLQRGRVTDVRGVSAGETGKVAEEEKRLRKIAQRGVVKLFNAVRAAQVRAEQAAREERKKGTVGMAHREEKVNEMSKQGFLELISNKAKNTVDVEDAEEEEA